MKNPTTLQSTQTGTCRFAAGKGGAGVLEGVSLGTAGEAKGAGLWLDYQFLVDVHVAAKRQAAAGGVKCMFGHPFDDGIGKFLGRFLNPRLAGDSVRGDLHLDPSASRSPEGDLIAYVKDLAGSDPGALGASLVFIRDLDAEDLFMLENSTGGVFRSPDPDNTRNLRHARLLELWRCDLVGEPAANPGGLFSSCPALAQLSATGGPAPALSLLGEYLHTDGRIMARPSLAAQKELIAQGKRLAAQKSCAVGQAMSEIVNSFQHRHNLEMLKRMRPELRAQYEFITRAEDHAVAKGLTVAAAMSVLSKGKRR